MAFPDQDKLFIQDASTRRILLLGGTQDARVIAQALSKNISDDGDIDAVLSLAGVTSNPPNLGIKTRIGGFGGAAGLAQFLIDEAVDLVIDATHPYASTMSANAAAASGQAHVKRMTLWRPAWQAEAEDDWTEFGGWDDLFAAVPNGANLFLAAGQDGMKSLGDEDRFQVWARALVEPAHLPKSVTLIKSLPAKTAAEEAALFTNLNISHLACKNSGGNASRAKLEAARQLNLPVLMLGRPTPPPLPLYDSAAEIIANL